MIHETQTKSRGAIALSRAQAARTRFRPAKESPNKGDRHRKRANHRLASDGGVPGDRQAHPSPWDSKGLVPACQTQSPAPVIRAKDLTTSARAELTNQRASLAPGGDYAQKGQGSQQCDGTDSAKAFCRTKTSADCGNEAQADGNLHQERVKTEGIFAAGRSDEKPSHGEGGREQQGHGHHSAAN